MILCVSEVHDQIWLLRLLWDMVSAFMEHPLCKQEPICVVRIWRRKWSHSPILYNIRQNKLSPQGKMHKIKRQSCDHTQRASAWENMLGIKNCQWRIKRIKRQREGREHMKTISKPSRWEMKNGISFENYMLFSVLKIITFCFLLTFYSAILLECWAFRETYPWTNLPTPTQYPPNLFNPLPVNPGTHWTWGT